MARFLVDEDLPRSLVPVRSRRSLSGNPRLVGVRMPSPAINQERHLPPYVAKSSRAMLIWPSAMRRARHPICNENGSSCTLKLEGIEVHTDDSDRFDVVADVDCADQPALGAVLYVRARSHD